MSRLQLILVLPALTQAFTGCVNKPAEAPVYAEAHHTGPVSSRNSTGRGPETKPVTMNERGRVSDISLEDFFQLHESGKTLVIDARPSFIYRFGHVPGSINLPKSHCADGIANLQGDLKSATAAGKTIVVYCTGAICPDARAVAGQLSISGYPASVLAGGWDAWKEAGMPVE